MIFLNAKLSVTFCIKYHKVSRDSASGNTFASSVWRGSDQHTLSGGFPTFSVRLSNEL